MNEELEKIKELLTIDKWTKVDCKKALEIRNRIDGYKTDNCFCTSTSRRVWKSEIKYWYEGESGKTRGLGDTVAKITKFFGIEPCEDCEKRRDYLNKRIPYDTDRD